MGALLQLLTGGLNAALLPQAGAAAVEVRPASFAAAAELMKNAGARLAAEWAEDETPFGRGFAVWAAYNKETEYLLVKAAAGSADPSFTSLSPHYVAAYRFERQIMGLYGIAPIGLPDTRPWIRHEDWPEGFYPLRKDADGASPMARGAGDYPWVRAEGEGVYEIPVGPVHAGIIEPGHFRFQAVGERVLNLEEKLGYVHKGIEKRFEALSWEEGARLAGRVSGDSTVAHALAYCMALENAAGMQPPPRARWVRALLLERERIANHLCDLAALCNDVAFTFGFYQFWNLRERMLRTNARFFGHRLLMDAVVPGGAAVDVTNEARDAISAETAAAREGFDRLIHILDDSASVRDRFFNTGKVPQAVAQALGLVGFAGKASGLNHDARILWPFEPYDTIVPKIHLLHSGDVHARAWTRVEEVRESWSVAGRILGRLPSGPVRMPPVAPPADARGFAAVEGWRGEVIYWLHAGPDGRVGRCAPRDPSALNWLALERSVREDMVPDFPLANKSFNNSYSGNDL